MAKSDDGADVPSPKVCSKTLQLLSKDKLIELLLETLEDYKNLSISKEMSDKALKFSKDHINYLNNTRSDVQERFFELLDTNAKLKDSFEKVKSENILLKVELSQYKLFCLHLDPSGSTEINIEIFNNDLEKLNDDLVTVREQKEKLEKELEIGRNSKKKEPMKIPKWVESAQTKRTEGLGYVYKKKNVKKKYVDLPSRKLCSFCGNTGHLSNTCSTKEKKHLMNESYVKQV